MALRVEYLIRETGTNLWRNVWLTVAAVLTVFVCLALFGVSILVGKGADSLSSQWKGGIAFIIFIPILMVLLIAVPILLIGVLIF